MKISEVSARTGMSLDTLRYYERIGLLPPVNRSENGIRNFDELDLRRVVFIKCMRNAGLPIETLIEYFQLLQAGDDTIDARKEILVAQRDQLLVKMAELQETLDLLNHKIEVYEKSLLKAERLIAEFEE